MDILLVKTSSIGGSSVGGFDLAQGAVKTLSGVTTFTTIPAASNGTYLSVAGVSTVGTGLSFNVYRDSGGGIGTVTATNTGLNYAVGTVVTLSLVTALVVLFNRRCNSECY